MELILTLVLLMIPVTFGYLIYKYVSGKQMTATNEMFQQRNVIVNYKSAAIQINRYTYPVMQVTGIALVTETNGRRNSYYVQIDVDDMKKPVHKIAVIGSKNDADEFFQRIVLLSVKLAALIFINPGFWVQYIRLSLIHNAQTT